MWQRRAVVERDGEVGARRGEDRGLGAFRLDLGAHARVIDGEGEVRCQQGQGFAVGAAQRLVIGPLPDRQHGDHVAAHAQGYQHGRRVVQGQGQRAPFCRSAGAPVFAQRETPWPPCQPGREQRYGDGRGAVMQQREDRARHAAAHQQPGPWRAAHGTRRRLEAGGQPGQLLRARQDDRVDSRQDAARLHELG